MEIFHEYAQKEKESVWGPFLNLLNRQDGFITNMTARIIAKIACWSQTPMERSDLHFYLTWLKDQLKAQVYLLLLLSSNMCVIYCGSGFCMAFLFVLYAFVYSNTNATKQNRIGCGGGSGCFYLW